MRFRGLMFLLVVLSALMALSFTSNSSNPKKKIITLVIDPGHGGRDPGKPRGSKTRLHEKELNLKIALKLGGYIKQKLKNVRVLYTRSTDKYVSLEERADFANRHKADYFISIHCNSNPNKWIQGTKTHIHSHSFKTSKLLANLIEEDFKYRAKRKSRGVMSAYDRGYNLFVLHATNMPSVLVEAGFMSNPTEEKYLNSEQGQTFVASSIFRAFKKMLSIKHPYLDKPTVYKVQIMASTKKISLSHREFKKLGMKVEELRIGASGRTSDNPFVYKYVVGNEFTREKANLLARKVKRLGFKDAFVVTLK